MPICYVVPGLFGSKLGSSPTARANTWIDYGALGLGLVGRMRLAADGTSPGGPDGVQMFVGGILLDYYGFAIRQLYAQLVPLGYTITETPYDWRLSARVTGAALAARIRAEVPAGSPCSIVAHSFGGLVARVAWAELAQTGETARIRRIVTLGSPHWGSYGVVQLFSLARQELDQVELLSAVSVAALGPPLAYALGRVWTADRLCALAATWPSLYETLPSLLAPSAAGDPNRAALYGPNWPAARGVSPAWLDYARTAWQPFAAGAASTPPSWVMTTVAGTGVPTPARLVYASLLGNPDALGVVTTGDGAVTVQDATLAGSAVVTIPSGHPDMPTVAADRGNLAGLVLEVRNPVSPVPPAVAVAGPVDRSLSGPPVPTPVLPARCDRVRRS